jgi:antitoxin FitA
MAAITIRQLSEEAKQQLRIRAAHNGRSMEAEARRVDLADSWSSSTPTSSRR